MSWLNALPAQPAISVRFRQRFLLIGEVLGLLEPFLNGPRAQEGRLRVGTSPPWDIDLEAPGGFIYRLRRDGLRVQFSYENIASGRSRMGAKTSTGLTTLSPIESIPFPDLLETTLTSASDLLKALAAREAMVERFGLEVTVPMGRAQAPLGVGRFLRSLGSLPGYEPIRASCQIFCRVAQRAGSDDRVHYDVQSSEDGDDIELRLDFQRSFEPVIRLKDPATVGDLAEFTGQALAHFEHFGSGAEGSLQTHLQCGVLGSEPSGDGGRPRALDGLDDSGHGGGRRRERSSTKGAGRQRARSRSARA
jgi:hypothetical protein